MGLCGTGRRPQDQERGVGDVAQLATSQCVSSHHAFGNASPEQSRGDLEYHGLGLRPSSSRWAEGVYQVLQAADRRWTRSQCRYGNAVIRGRDGKEAEHDDFQRFVAQREECRVEGDDDADDQQEDRNCVMVVNRGSELCS